MRDFVNDTPNTPSTRISREPSYSGCYCLLMTEMVDLIGGGGSLGFRTVVLDLVLG